MPTVHRLPARLVPAERAEFLAVRRFMDENGEAVVEAADLIAGPREAARAGALLAALGRAPQLTARLRAELGWLHRLLALELDPGHGVGVHPDDPRLHGICRITDALGDLLAEIAPHAPEPAAPAAAMPAAPRPPRRATG